MREIKFRAWSQVSEKMTKSFNLEWLKFNTPVPKDFTKEAGFADDLIFMQYTGLKDKNGVEIYEGDIVRNRSIDKTIGEVIFKGVGFIVMEEGVSTTLIDDKYEVIGNIYQNPELLK